MSSNQTAPTDALVAAGLAHHRAGRFKDAEHTYRRALALDPGEPQALALLGMLAGQGGQLPIAAELLTRALQRAPDNPDIHYNLGETLRMLGRLSEAYGEFQKTAALKPDNAEAYRGASECARELGKRALAANRGDDARQLNQVAARCFERLGTILLLRNDNRGAEAAFRDAITCDEKDAASHYGLARALRMRHQPSAALTAAERAVALNPRDAGAQLVRGNALWDLGRLEEAASAQKSAISLTPQNDFVRRNADTFKLMTRLYDETADAPQIFALHRDWGTALATTSAPAFANARDPETRLRVGYVSPDFKQHSIMRFFLPLLENHDPAAIETFCYSSLPTPADDATAAAKQRAQHWVEVYQLTDEQLRERVRADGVDILIDLSGHTAANRLRAFAVKPAPVTVTWLGYPATTGLSTMDWRITDAIADPAGSEVFHTEKLMRLPEGFLCYQPPAQTPAVSPLPAASAGHVTFGSFNHTHKIGPGTIALWSRVLQAAPNSHLVLKSTLTGDPGIRQHLLDQFAAHGIAPARIQLLGWLDAPQNHLAAYGKIDIGLDPFPYNGTTTTCEALWMGVPVVTLIGDRHSGRVGLDLLTRVGLEKLAAADLDSYVRIAAELAGDLAALAELRTGLRARMERSPLCDAPRFARDFEAALRTMWRAYCESA